MLFALIMMSIKRFVFFLALFLMSAASCTHIVIPASAASTSSEVAEPASRPTHQNPPRTCVVSLLATSSDNAELVNDTKSILSQMDTSDSQKVHFIVNVMGTQKVYAALRFCLEGEFEEVILVAHSKEEVVGKPSIVYPASQDPKTQEVKVMYLNDAFFLNGQLKINPKLKMVTLATCQTEILIQQYMNFSQLLSKHNIYLRAAPFSPVLTQLASWAANRQMGRITWLKKVSNLIAESGQNHDLLQGRVFCYIYDDSLNPGFVLCNRGKIKFFVHPKKVRFGIVQRLEPHWVLLVKNQTDNMWMWHGWPFTRWSDRPGWNEIQQNQRGPLSFDVHQKNVSPFDSSTAALSSPAAVFLQFEFRNLMDML